MINIPVPEVNRLTERLLAQGVSLDDPTTWPEDVWRCDPNNFAYKRELRFMPTWESPCGLLVRGYGDFWGETWVGGEFHCAENDNPLFECPRPGVPCAHRLPYPAGMNCQFHRTERVWTEDESCERLIRERIAVEQQWREVQMREHPGFEGFCANLHKEELPDGMFRYEKNYRLERCISFKCKNTQCPCMGWRERDVRPANIFYDLYIERRYTEGLVPYSEKTVIKGMRVFDRAVAKHDAELALKIWQRNPNARMLPSQMLRRLDVAVNLEHNIGSKEVYFVRTHGKLHERECRVHAEIRNIRVARQEGRDLMQDLQDVRDGIAVQHASDMQKAAKAQQNERYQAGKIKQMAQRMAKEMRESGAAPEDTHVGGLLKRRNAEFSAAVEAEAMRIIEKTKEKKELENIKAVQISIFDINGETI